MSFEEEAQTVFVFAVWCECPIDQKPPHYCKSMVWFYPCWDHSCQYLKMEPLEDAIMVVPEEDIQ